jgi:HSP20 family protein
MANVIRWNPVREMAAMQNLMDRMFDENWRAVRPTNALQGTPLALDVHENTTSYTVTTALPGVNADNIQINLNDDVLTISAEVNEQQFEGEGTRTLMQERTYGKFSRRIRLPHPVNSEAVEAQYVDGVLTLTLPKAENALPRNIPVKHLNSNNN